MIVALEPGIYFRDRFGVRVERSYLVEYDGALELTLAAQDANGRKETS